MANTTNFGWETPDDTDLVKDGAAAMRTLGNAIDASLVDLKGGTTGQVLSKNTNTDMDFVWTTPQTGDITEVTAGTGLSGGGTSGAVTLTNTVATTFDAKGDLVVGTGADTFAKLVAGSNGETLVADSSATTGLRWQSVPSGGNPIINSAMDIWQRGTSFTITAATQYAADRFFVQRGGGALGATVTRQTTGDTTNLPNIQYSLRHQRNSGNTATEDLRVYHQIETVDSIPYAGKTVTLSFYARAGANYSAASSALNFSLYSGTGVDQNIRNVGFTGQSTRISQTATLTTTWQRFSFTGTIPSTTTEIALEWVSGALSGTAGANDWFELTGVQMDIGSVALPYRRYSATLAGELAACQRYYYLHASGDSRSIGVGASGDSTNLYTAIQFPTTMRTAPTLTAASGTGFYVCYANGTNDNLDSWLIDRASTTSSWIYSAQNNTTIGFAGIVRTANASASIAFSSEL